MFKEKIKTSIIIVLLINLVFLTNEAWFKSGIIGSEQSYFSFADLPFVRFFARNNIKSVPKENLSKPRKLVVNDGELWVPYYNTDEAFGNLDEQTRKILECVLEGEYVSEDAITYDEWLNLLIEPGIYVEYPINVTPEMLSKVLNTGFESLGGDIQIVGDAIITPRDDSSVYIGLRDANTNKAYKYLVNDESVAFPKEVLAMYTKKYSRDGYYEFAFSTLLGEGMGESGVKISELVLFSDNKSSYRDIRAENPIENGNYEQLLKSFSFNPQPLRHYSDKQGAENFVENYATVTIFPDGYIEYSAVDSEKGIDLGGLSDDDYEILNSAIDFAEKVWASVSDEPLNVLVSGVEKTNTGNRFTFDYYYGGREIGVLWQKEGRDDLYHAIEIETTGGRITSYRQYLRNYTESVSVTEQESFVLALDYFVDMLSDEDAAVITDLYPGYFDDGRGGSDLKTTWLCEIDNSEERFPKR